MNRIIFILIFLMIICLSTVCTESTLPTMQPTYTPIKNGQSITLPVSTVTETQTVITSESTNFPVINSTQIIPQVTNTQSNSNILNGQLIILRDLNSNYLENIITGAGYKLLAEGNEIDILKWESDGCKLIVRTSDGIFEIDLLGNILRTIFPFERLPDINNGVILLPPTYGRRAIDLLSPDQLWISYKIGRGAVEQRGDDREPIRYEFEDLETIPVDGSEGPYLISQRGGAWRASWSPDSLQVAYSDYDETGRHQLYLISRNGNNRRQITFFSDYVEIMRILWSPDGSTIAVLIDQNNDGSEDKTILINTLDIGSIKEYSNILAKWWRNNASLIATEIIEQGSTHIDIIIYDINKNQKILVRSNGCFRMNPFGTLDIVGCMTADNQFIVYDTYNSNIMDYPNFINKVNLIQYWIAAPKSATGGQCDNLP